MTSQNYWNIGKAFDSEKCLKLHGRYLVPSNITELKKFNSEFKYLNKCFIICLNFKMISTPKELHSEGFLIRCEATDFSEIMTFTP
eukprot:jgi/Bigna1/140916/aug1.59_g15624